MISESTNQLQISVHSGVLKRKGALLGIWHQCYCEMKDGIFSIFKNSSAQAADRVVKVTAETNIQMVTGDKLPRFIVENPGEQSIVLSSDDEAEILTWVLVLRSATYTNTTMTMDNFRIISVIGRGFYGKVMLCQNKDTCDLCAIKTIRKSRLVQSNKIYTVLRERNILVKARNPFVVSLYYAFQTDTKFYFVLEYVPGGELFHRMQNEDRIPFRQARLYIAEVALALQYLHSIGVVYRDLKPENVLISKDGHIKLTDFGLSKDLDNDDSTSTFCGTPEYVAPEIIRRDHYGKEIDWWSLGILTYELMFNRLPFEAPNRPKLFQQILGFEPAYPSGADPAIVDFVKRLLVKDPKKRAGFKQIKDHPFWKGLDLDQVARLNVRPEFRPSVEMNPAQKPQNFDSEYTKEQPFDSVSQPVSGAAVHFSGFSFDATGTIDKEIEPNGIHVFQPVYTT